MDKGLLYEDQLYKGGIKLPPLYLVETKEGKVSLCVRPVLGFTYTKVYVNFRSAGNIPGVTFENLLSVRGALRSGLLSELSLLRKSGAVVCGFEKVRSRLRADAISVILQAPDGSVAEQKRLTAGLRGGLSKKIFSSDELGRVCGREKAHHVGLAKTTFAAEWIKKASAFEAFVNT